MTDQNAAPPQTLQLDQPAASAATPAAGGGAPPQTLQLDAPAPPSSTGVDADEPQGGAAKFAYDTLKGVHNAARGVLEGAGDTVSGVAHLVNKIPGIGETLAPSQGIRALDSLDKANTTGEQVGKGVENIAEFAAGDEALSGLAKASKIVELAQKYPVIADTLKLAKDHPFIAKMITESGKGAVVGGAQGAVKGAQEGNATGGAEAGGVGGAIGGAAGTAVGELASAAIKPFAEKLGIGTTAGKDATIAARPGKRNYNFVKDFEAVAPRIDAAEQAVDATGAKNPSKTMEDWANTVQNARESLYQKEVQPLLDKYGDRPLSGIDIANRVRADIPEALKKFSPEKAAQVEEFANQFLPGQRFELQAKDAERYIQHLNAELASTGYWKLDGSSRAALEKTNPDIIKWKAAGDAIRDELYGKLGDWQTADHVPNPTDMAKLKRDYGSLRNIENEVRGRVNVDNRQSPVSLKETIGLITGLSHGGPVGALIAGLPVADRVLNSPERVFARAVEKGAHPGTVSGLEKAGSAAKAAAPQVGAQAGAGGARLFFTASDGSEHSVDASADAPAQIHAIDPNAKFHSAPQQ